MARRKKSLLRLILFAVGGWLLYKNWSKVKSVFGSAVSGTTTVTDTAENIQVPDVSTD